MFYEKKLANAVNLCAALKTESLFSLVLAIFFISKYTPFQKQKNWILKFTTFQKRKGHEKLVLRVQKIHAMNFRWGGGGVK